MWVQGVYFSIFNHSARLLISHTTTYRNPAYICVFFWFPWPLANPSTYRPSQSFSPKVQSRDDDQGIKPIPECHSGYFVLNFMAPGFSFGGTMNDDLVGGWTNPSEKICARQNGSFRPNRDEIKNLWKPSPSDDLHSFLHPQNTDETHEQNKVDCWWTIIFDINKTPFKSGGLESLYSPGHGAQTTKVQEFFG